MRFGLVHRIMTDALAALGVVALVVSGQFQREAQLALIVALLLAVSMKEPWRHEAGRRHLDTIALFALMATQIGRATLSAASVLDLLIEFAVGLQIIRVATRRGAAHDQQIIVLALLHLIAGTVVGGGLGYGLCFFGLLVVTPGALVLSHLRREVEGNYRQGARDRTGLPVDVPRILRSKRVVGRQFIAVTCLLSVPILIFTISLFIVFPRVGLSLLLLNRPHGGRMIGFSGKVDLGQIGTLRSDPTIALRVTYDKQAKPPPRRKVMHLRGTALDHYDGHSWIKTNEVTRTVASGGEAVPINANPDPQTDAIMRVELEPIDPPVLFLPPHAKGLRLVTGSIIGAGNGLRVQRGPEGEFRYSAPNNRGVHYEIYLSTDGAPTFRHLRPSERRRYLQLPSDLPDRVRELGRRWIGASGGALAAARIIERRLRNDYQYDLASPSGAADNPLDDFLFVSKRGHCEYYSTAMAVMLRSLGIPSRNVTGFIGGSYNSFGEFYAVRQGDAHSWVEAFVDGRGWLTFDPTPPSAAVPLSEVDGMLASIRDFFEAISQRWDQHVLGYDLSQQVTLFESFNTRSTIGRALAGRPHAKALLLAFGLLLVVLSGYWLHRRRRHADRKPEPAGGGRSKEATLATNLYRTLDQAMLAVGLARPSSLPPLRHAAEVLERGHPCGPEILALTRRYLVARFGRRPLSLRERRDFERRTKEIRSRGALVEVPNS